MKVIEQQIKVTLLTNIGDYQEDWVKVYIEPNNAYSDCGGRITVNIGDDHIGSHFFSHCGTETFEQFIGKVGYDYLINKLFQTQNWIDVESGDELFQSLLDNEILYRVKDARASGWVSKDELRELYEELKDREFRDIGELSNMLGSSECETMAKMFNDDWFYDGNFKKRNRVYDRQKAAIQAVIDHFGAVLGGGV
ncbi:hypothetical protein [Acinetobacter sp. YH12123]|uniref:hypothetical protein n=1 Tax=Acinetobacter sp. YH12123 TaxID=2601108 RepID=UPI0015D3E1CC|nr:hypothetical protein [Acinetobacter sp. YH12123]